MKERLDNEPNQLQLLERWLDPLGSKKMAVLARRDSEVTVGDGVLDQILSKDRFVPVNIPEDLYRLGEVKFEGDALLAVGGDGTLNLAARLLHATVRTRLPLVLVPAGTGNDLCRAILATHELDLETFMQTEHVIRTHVDLIEVNFHDGSPNTCFLNMLSGGSSAKQAEELDDEIKAKWGRWTYLVQFWKTVTNLEVFSVEVRRGTDVQVYDEVVNFFIANGPTCGGGYRVVEGADCTDGQADLVIVRRGTPGQWTSLAADFLRLKHLEHPLVEPIRAAVFSLALSQEVGITLDGEPHAAKQLDIRVIPHGIDLWLCSPEVLRHRWTPATTEN